MSEPRTRRRGTWWVVAGLLVTCVLICVRVGLPIYRRKQAIDAIERIGGVVEFGALPKYPKASEGWLRACATVIYIGTCPRSFVNNMNAGGFVKFGVRNQSARQRARDLVRNLAQLDELASLNLSTAYLDDDDLAVVAGLRSLELLDLSNTPLRATGLKHLKRLSRLQQLDLSGTDIDDEALRYLTELSELRFLCLDQTNVTNDGMQFIAKLPNLRDLSVSNTGVTDLGLEELRRTHPGLSVTDD
jgi:hypothetical protein